MPRQKKLNYQTTASSKTMSITSNPFDATRRLLFQHARDFSTQEEFLQYLSDIAIVLPNVSKDLIKEATANFHARQISGSGNDENILGNSSTAPVSQQTNVGVVNPYLKKAPTLMSILSAGVRKASGKG